MLLTPALRTLMILVGLCAGILSGLVGAGGGSVIVPGMELAADAGNLTARGMSLLVMIPTGITDIATSLRHRMVDLRVGLVVGVSAAAATPVGYLVVTRVSPSVGVILFSVFLLFIIASTVLKMHRKVCVQNRAKRPRPRKREVGAEASAVSVMGGLLVDDAGARHVGGSNPRVEPLGR